MYKYYIHCMCLLESCANKWSWTNYKGTIVAESLEPVILPIITIALDFKQCFDRNRFQLCFHACVC